MNNLGFIIKMMEWGIGLLKIKVIDNDYFLWFIDLIGYRVGYRGF